MTIIDAKNTVTHTSHTAKLSIFTVGMSLGLFLAFTFTICVIFDLVFPAYAMYPAWSMFLPGFKWLSFSAFLLGLLETFLYGWYTAFVFVPIHNWFSR